MNLHAYYEKAGRWLGTARYWLVLGKNYGYVRQARHLWRRWRDPEHERIGCVCCCADCDIEEER